MRKFYYAVVLGWMITEFIGHFLGTDLDHFGVPIEMGHKLIYMCWGAVCWHFLCSSTEFKEEIKNHFAL